jgi:hypothetical protein
MYKIKKRINETPENKISWQALREGAQAANCNSCAVWDETCTNLHISKVCKQDSERQCARV